MNQIERIVLWVLVGLNLVGMIVLTVAVFGELDAVNRQLLVLTEGDAPDAPQQPAPVSAHQVAIAGVDVLSDTVAMTVTVRSAGAGDLLFEPPVLKDHAGRTYPVDGDSLKAARLAFLDLVTKGQATARFEFAGRLTPTPELRLVFNPGQETTNIVAPRIETQVPLRTGAGGE